MGHIHTAISETKITYPFQDPAMLFEEPAHGAEVVFFGKVRNLNHGRKVHALSYDVFVPLAVQTLREIAREAQDRWGEGINVAVIHRSGRLDIGDVAVIVAVSSAHRHECYETSRYVIENLKTRAPIWKKEHYEGSESQWLQGHALCGHAGIEPHTGHTNHKHGVSARNSLTAGQT